MCVCADIFQHCVCSRFCPSLPFLQVQGLIIQDERMGPPQAFLGHMLHPARRLRLLESQWYVWAFQSPHRHLSPALVFKCLVTLLCVAAGAEVSDGCTGEPVPLIISANFWRRGGGSESCQVGTQLLECLLQGEMSQAYWSQGYGGLAEEPQAQRPSQWWQSPVLHSSVAVSLLVFEAWWS